MSRYLQVRMVLDRLLAAVGLVALSPVIGVLGWLVHRHDGGPAFITVERVGRHGRPMRMWKLRSMRAESADGRATGVSLTSAGDDRITPIGAKLRAGHLDELPQLFNVARGEMAREGIGVIEAPRGTLFHHYRIDEDGLIEKANLIVSTTNNNQAMNESIRQVAERYLDGKELTEPLLNQIEVAVRAYDPCLSCATHALGQMPLIVELVEEESGAVVDSLTRDADGVVRNYC